VQISSEFYSVYAYQPAVIAKAQLPSARVPQVARAAAVGKLGAEMAAPRLRRTGGAWTLAAHVAAGCALALGVAALGALRGRERNGDDVGALRWPRSLQTTWLLGRRWRAGLVAGAQPAVSGAGTAEERARAGRPQYSAFALDVRAEPACML
jgi:hypothetical protein